jgi:hypothetical protein
VRKRTSIILILSVIAVLLVAFFLVSDLVFDLGFGIIRETVFSSSVATLTQVRTVLSLNTVEVVRKVVFPYDFVPADIDWNLFLRGAERRQLSPLEADYLETYRICREIGINLASKRREFVVITTIIKAGFDLSNPVFASPEQAGEELAEKYIQTDALNGVTVILPPAIITDLIIEDADTTSYSYPDIEIGPENWKTLTSFVAQKIESEAVSGDVLNLATENGKQFLERLLLDSGYSSVTFSQ